LTSPAPASQPIGRLRQVIGKVSCDLRRFPVLEAMLGHELRQEAAIDPPRDIVPGGYRQERAGVIVEADCVVKASRLGHLTAEAAHPFGTVVKPPRRP